MLGEKEDAQWELGVSERKTGWCLMHGGWDGRQPAWHKERSSRALTAPLRQPHTSSGESKWIKPCGRRGKLIYSLHSTHSSEHHTKCYRSLVRTLWEHLALKDFALKEMRRVCCVKPIIITWITWRVSADDKNWITPFIFVIHIWMSNWISQQTYPQHKDRLKHCMFLPDLFITSSQGAGLGVGWDRSKTLSLLYIWPTREHHRGWVQAKIPKNCLRYLKCVFSQMAES